MATKIMLDPGHGGRDAGATFGDRKEKDEVLQLAFDVGEELRRLGYDVEYTRVSDVYDSPIEKARIGNASGADFFVSFHRNSSPTPNQYQGVETLLYSDTGVKADMARNINDRLEDVGFKNLGVDVRRDLAVLRRTQMPALLLEVGFINSDVDNQTFDANPAEIAQAIALGIDETLNNQNSQTAFSDDKSNEIANEFYGYRTSMPVFADESDIDSMNMECTDQQCVNQDIKEEKPVYQILVSIYRSMGMANFKMNELINFGFDAAANEVDGLYQVRVGAFETIEDALAIQEQLRRRGYESLIVTGVNGNIV